MAQECYLGVDLGAESGRVIAGLFDGKRMQLEELFRFQNGPIKVAGTLRWDVLKLWQDIQQGLACAADRFGNAIVSVGVDTWGVDYVLMTENFELLGLPYNYRDSRTDGLLNETLSRVPKREIFMQTGLQFMQINTLYQLVAMQKANPRLLDMASTFLMMPDFFHWLLCGSRVVEFTNATTTQCLNAETGDWAFDLLGKLEIPHRMFPEVVAPGTRLGKLRAAVATDAGLSRIDVVTPGTHDTASAVAAVPTARTGQATWAYISSGTWSLLGVEVPGAILNDQALAVNVTNEGGIDGTYRLLKNIMGLWLVQGCRRSFERSGESMDYDAITQSAERAPAFRSFVDPDDSAFLQPDDMAGALKDWCRESAQHVPETPGALVRCVLESLALKYATVLGWLEGLTGQRVEAIHIVGGGCRNELLNQFTANACGRPVIAGPVEATALGNLLVQVRTAGGINSLSDIRAVVKASSELKEYEPRDQPAWQAAYKRFAELLSRPRSR